ncbi:hypothetical protein [Ferrimonas pelagia]|uniref:Uncharacterized protein n=1 Tax=Ferrimonas pelagia TaxID=1177826 RepID=A0ABP9EVH1_9GAMM
MDEAATGSIKSTVIATVVAFSFADTTISTSLGGSLTLTTDALALHDFNGDRSGRLEVYLDRAIAFCARS